MNALPSRGIQRQILKTGASPGSSLRRMASRTGCVAVLFAIIAYAVHPGTDPWMPEQTIGAEQFSAELQASKGPKPTIVYVGFKTLYAGAHIPGAVYHGPGSTEAGITELKKFAATLPKSADVVVYCGCCPLEKCPNLRPAFVALKDMGFARLRVLILPASFNADWVEKGYPVHKGDAP